MIGMGRLVDVIYENGVFRPVEKIPLKDGEKLKIEIKVPKRITPRFYRRSSELEEKTPKVQGASKVLEDMRSARY